MWVTTPATFVWLSVPILSLSAGLWKELRAGPQTTWVPALVLQASSCVTSAEWLHVSGSRCFLLRAQDLGFQWPVPIPWPSWGYCPLLPFTPKVRGPHICSPEVAL